MQSLPDLVRLSRLNARFSSDPEYTEHSRDVLASPLERRLIRKEERWKKEKLLGCGSFGDVWLQECIYGDSKGKARAVKQMRKLQNTNYDGELEATAFFSHHEVSMVLLAMTYGSFSSEFRLVRKMFCQVFWVV